MGGKFTPEGKVLPFPGNTFLCHVDPQSEFYRALCTVQDELQAHRLADHFAFLPKPSFHMTLFCGVSGSPLGSDGWPEGIPPDASLEQITAEFADRLTCTTFDTAFSVTPSSLSQPNSVTMQAATAKDERLLRKLRFELESLTGLYRGDVESYSFHVSLAYLVRWLGERSAQELIMECARLFEAHLKNCAPIRFENVALCTFADMRHFNEVRRL